MPRSVDLVARHSFNLAGHWVVTGELFTAREPDADILVRVGHATYAPPHCAAPATDPEPLRHCPIGPDGPEGPEGRDQAKPKRTYRRRAQHAEDDGSPPTRRTYRRRDLQAEE